MNKEIRKYFQHGMIWLQVGVAIKFKGQLHHD